MSSQVLSDRERSSFYKDSATEGDYKAGGKIDVTYLLTILWGCGGWGESKMADRTNFSIGRRKGLNPENWRLNS